MDFSEERVKGSNDLSRLVVACERHDHPNTLSRAQESDGESSISGAILSATEAFSTRDAHPECIGKVRQKLKLKCLHTIKQLGLYVCV